MRGLIAVLDVFVDHFDFLLHQFDVVFQFFYLAVQFSQQAVSFLRRCVQEAQIVLVGLQFGLHVVAGAYKFLAFAVEGL